MKDKKSLILMFLLYPIVVQAETNGNSMFNFMSIGTSILIELFVSIHMSSFVLQPMSKIISKDNPKKTFWTLFIIRAIILFIFDIFVTPAIAMIDFFAVFVGAFLIVPIATFIHSKKTGEPIFGVLQTNNNNDITQPISSNSLKCSNCGGILKPEFSFCIFCGQKVDNSQNYPATSPEKIKVLPSYFEPIYSLSEDAMVEEFIKKELSKASIDINNKLIPTDILKRKKILNLILSFLLFVYISLIFFHFPILTYLMGFIILIIFFIITRRYNFIKYLKKEIKARPSEKISNIVMRVKTSFVEDNSSIMLLFSILIAIGLPLIIFASPKIIYEEVDGGYAMRFYAYGLSNFKNVDIPSEYNGKPVVSLRGNAFSNMYFLKSVNLPDTIVEIRGQAFKNDLSLVDVKLPDKLRYLGGGSFANCISLKSVDLPDTLTYIGGETFMNAVSLENIILPPNITEIRGNTFEECDSLKSINIPDKVTRIGGHAFYGCSSLSEVNINENSNLKEIGSSAFRLCYNLRKITIPRNTFVNERAFKESSTIVYRFGQSESDYYYSNY